MMKTFGMTLLAMLLIVSFAFANDAVSDSQKQAVKDAIELYKAGQPLTGAQKDLIREHVRGWTNNLQIDNTGGPDGYGYVYKDSEEADGPVYAWVDNTVNGTEFVLANLMGDESEAGPFPIGPAGEVFNFYGVDYDAFWVESNGPIMFTDPGFGFGYSTEPLPTDDNSSDPPAIFPFWDDMDLDNGAMGYYSYEDVGGTMATVITFVDADAFPGSDTQDTVTFQTLLFQDGRIVVQYADFSAGAYGVDSETIGIQASSAGPALQASHSDVPLDYPYTGLAIEFYVDDTVVTGYATGTVTDLDTGLPIEGATFTFGGTPYVTDVDGMYTTATVQTGMYDWTLTAPLYDGQDGTYDLMEGENVIDFQMSAAVFDQDVLLIDVDETPDSGPAIQTIIEDLGYTTYYTTDFFGAPMNDFEYVFVFTGMWPNDFPIATDSAEETALIDYLNQGGNLFIDGGDNFAYTPPANLMDLLPINGDADGGSDLANVLGVADTFTEEFDLAYAGENSYIDHISVDGDALMVLTNPDDGAGCGAVAANFAGFSFELGMLVDGDFGTRSDIVAGVFDVFINGLPDPPDPDPVVVTLTPVGDPFVPAAGGTIDFDVNIVSNLDQLYTGVWFFTTVMLPNGNMYPPNLFQTQFNMPPFMNAGGQLGQDIPDFAPAGMYTLYGTVAGNPNGVGPNFSDSFDFEKGEVFTGTNPVGDWASHGSLQLAGEDAEVVALPAEFELKNVYPNPFNPTANVTVALPNAADLTVTVFNVMGQQVAELASGQIQAGTHNFVLDGSSLASGIYFVQATVPGELNAVQKVTLMK